MKKKIEQREISEVLLNTFQACNYFRLVGNNRRLAIAKFDTGNFTVKEWEIKLKEYKLMK